MVQRARNGILFVLSALKERNFVEGLDSVVLFSGLSPWQVRIFEQGLATYTDFQKEVLISALVDWAEEDALLDFAPIFKAMLRDPVPGVRRAAVNGLWEDIDASLGGTLLHLLQNDPDASVRAAVATALGRFLYLVETEELDQTIGMAVENALFAVWYDPQEPLLVRRRALESLAFLGERAAALIEKAYLDRDLPMRVSSVFAMGRSLLPRWERNVLQELESDSEEMRYEAAIAAGELQLSAAVPSLMALVREDETMIAGAAIWALGEIGNQAAITALKDLRRDERLRDVLGEEIGDALESAGFWAAFFDSDDGGDFFYEFGEGDDLGETSGGALSPL